MLKNWLKLPTLGLLVFPGLLCAQHQVEVPQDSSKVWTSGQPVIITATRSRQPNRDVSYAVQKINLRDNENTGLATSLADAIQTVPGVTIQDRNNRALGERIMVRGIGSRAQFGVRGVKLLLDNIPLTLPDGQSQTGLINPNYLGSVEVIRGPASSLYGNAAGGVIAMHTQVPKSEDFQATAQLTSGSFGRRAFSGKIGRGGQDSGYLLGFSSTASSGFREHSASKYRRAVGLYRWEVTNDVRTTAVLHAYDAPYLLNPSSLDKETSQNNPASARNYIKQQGAGERVQHFQGGVTTEVHLGENARWESTVYGSTRDLYNPIPGSIIALFRKSAGVRSVLNWTPAGFDRAQITMGIDLGLQNDHRTEYTNEGLPDSMVGMLEPDEILANVEPGVALLDQREFVYNFEPFIVSDYRILPALSLTAGGRLNYYRYRVEDHLKSDGTDLSDSRSMAQFTPMFGISFHPVHLWNIYANYTTAFQTPTTNELSNRPDGGGGFAPNLEPEFIRNFEVGSRGRLSPLVIGWDIALFRMSTHQMLIPYQVESSESEAVYFENAGSAENNGMELRLGYQPMRRLRTAVSFTYQHFVFDEYLVEEGTSEFQLSGNSVPGIPDLAIEGKAQYSWDSGHYLRITSRYQSDYFTNNWNGPPPEVGGTIPNYVNNEYFTMDIGGGIAIPLQPVTIKLAGEVSNVTDVRYNGSIVPNAFGGRFFEPAPGRSYRMNVSITFESSKN